MMPSRVFDRLMMRRGPGVDRFCTGGARGPPPDLLPYQNANPSSENNLRGATKRVARKEKKGK